MGARVQRLIMRSYAGGWGNARAKLKRTKWTEVVALAAALAVLAGSASAQFMPKMSLGKEEKKPQTPEEQERQKQLDDAYKAATNKIPAQSANDPWASVRPAPATPAPKKTPQ